MSDSKAKADAAGAAQQAPFYQLYRRSSLGNALVESLDELIQSGHINPQLALRVLSQFDKSASQTLGGNLKTKCSAKGRLSTYNLCDEVWTFVLRNPTFKLENNQEVVGPLAGRCKIVACKAGSADAK